MPPPLGHPLLDEIVSVYLESAVRLRALLLDMLSAESMPRRFNLYRQTLRILKDLEEYSSEWGRTAIHQFFTAADQQALIKLATAKSVDLFAMWDQVNEQAVSSLLQGMTGHFEQAIASVGTLARKVMHSTSLESLLDLKVRREVAVGLASGVHKEVIAGKIKDALRARFQNGLVTILGTNGRQYQFTLDYYAGLVTHQTQRQAMSLAMITRARQNQWDLVRVSANPSTIGDYCDAYRGRVFSLTGQTPQYPLLEETPSGGPPFHPWCKHSLAIFVPELHTADEVSEWQQVDKRFLTQGGERTGNDINRLWNTAKKKDAFLAELVHI